MARYGTREREDELLALEREDREVFDDEPSGGYYGEMARLAMLEHPTLEEARAEDEANAAEEAAQHRTDAHNGGPCDCPPWTPTPCAHDGHDELDCLPF